jgi:CHAD domain-containing protein
MTRASASGRRSAPRSRVRVVAPGPPEIGAILTASLEERWRMFQMQLRRTRRRSTEASVHDLRVSMRRLMATADMIRTFIPDEGLEKTRRSLRKHLKAFNQLRDTHIQILALRALAREYPPLRQLGAELRAREAKLIRAARGTIASIKPTQLERSLADVSVRLGTLLHLPGMEGVATATVVGAMGAAFARAFELRQQVNPGDPSSIHRLRVVFKRCRYMMEVLQPILPGVDKRFLKSLNAYQTRMGDIQDMQVITACVNSFTLKSRYAPTLSLVPVQQRLAEMRKQRVDEFLARADELYALWVTAGIEPHIPASPVARPRRTSRADGGPSVVRKARTSIARRRARRGIRRRRARH